MTDHRFFTRLAPGISPGSILASITDLVSGIRQTAVFMEDHWPPRGDVPAITRATDWLRDRARAIEGRDQWTRPTIASVTNTGR